MGPGAEDSVRNNGEGARLHGFDREYARERVALEIFRTTGGLQEHTDWYANRRDGAIASLASAGLAHLPIEGSFYAAVHVGDAVETLPFAHTLVDEHDVVAIPGSTFGEAFEGWLRCSWVATPDRVRDGFARIAAATLRLTEAGVEG